MSGVISVPSTQERILRSAVENFSQKGYNGTSVRHITTSSNITKPTLYYYYRTKEELYLDVAKRSFDQVLKRLKKPLIDGKSALERLIEFVNSYFRLCDECESTMKFLYLISLFKEDGVPDIGKCLLKEMAVMVDDILAQGLTNGELTEGGKAEISYVASALCHFKMVNLMHKTNFQVELPLVQKIIKSLF